MNQSKKKQKDRNAGEGCVVWVAFIFFFGFGAFLILWNAKRASGEIDRLKNAELEAVTIKSHTYNPDLEGVLVVLAGPVETNYIFDDEYFGLAFNGITYDRKVSEFREADGEYWWSDRGQFDNPLFLKREHIEEDLEGFEYMSLKLKADSGIRIGNYRIDPALLESDDLYAEPIMVAKYLKLEKGKTSFYQAELNAITNSKNYDYPEVGDLEISFNGLANGSNITVLGIQKDSSIVRPEGRLPHGAVRGYRNAKSVVDDLKTGKEDLDNAFNFLGLFLLFIGIFPFRFIIRNFLYRVTHQKLLKLKLHILLTSLTLWAISYWLLHAFGSLIFKHLFIPGLIELGKAAVLAVVFVMLVRKEIPGFLFRNR